jgi:hypothetical protein
MYAFFRKGYVLNTKTEGKILYSKTSYYWDWSFFIAVHSSAFSLNRYSSYSINSNCIWVGNSVNKCPEKNDNIR